MEEILHLCAKFSLENRIAIFRFTRIYLRESPLIANQSRALATDLRRKASRMPVGSAALLARVPQGTRSFGCLPSPNADLDLRQMV